MYSFYGSNTLKIILEVNIEQYYFVFKLLPIINFFRVFFSKIILFKQNPLTIFFVYKSF